MLKALNWRKSSHSTPDGPNCVELANLHEAGAVAIRDSKHPEHAHLSVPRHNFARLTTRIRTGDLDS
ncbi:DUF397 domain-containing protein [Actinocorallia sp. API 0066]|uniref:DUF397 domain-containing protein n=1 Tax=Actinocorallia sp. API 0066 TaxID=2896846 RepID=UPI001E5B5888|nr:DUF397 domain-containing protein [Actinocorallia sp. API 0066]MCD0452529.1 DUF397 domain-containing protein [Actinocorallia sp. API 0066]